MFILTEEERGAIEKFCGRSGCSYYDSKTPSCLSPFNDIPGLQRRVVAENKCHYARIIDAVRRNEIFARYGKVVNGVFIPSV